jgi:serpin B
MATGTDSPSNVSRAFGNAFRPLMDRYHRSVVRRLRFEKLEDRYMLAGGSLGELFVTEPSDDSADTELVASTSALSLNTQELAAEKLVADAINALSRDLIKDLEQRGNGGNVFVSPMSIATALAMAYAGARDSTAAQLAHVLHLDHVDPKLVHAGFAALLRDINSLGQSDKVSLSAANAIWAQDGMELLSDFKSIIQDSYGGALNRYDFKRDPEGARTVINQWIAEETHEKIKELFPAGSIKDDTRLVLANAMYLKSQWLHAFDESQTYDQPFYLADGTQSTASMMHQQGQFKYLNKDGYQALELPYADGRLSMVVMLPTDVAQGNAKQRELPANLNTWLDGLQWTDVSVALPKFKIDTGVINLNDTLVALGFDLRSNRLDGIFPWDGHDYKIKDVYHRAFIEVDESGTEAAAATGGVGVVVTSVIFRPRQYINFTANHAFHFVIRDNASGSILFQGEVTHPVAGEPKNDGGAKPKQGRIIIKPIDEVPPEDFGDDMRIDIPIPIPTPTPVIPPTIAVPVPVANDPPPPVPGPSPTPPEPIPTPVMEAPPTDLPNEPIASTPTDEPPASAPIEESPPVSDPAPTGVVAEQTPSEPVTEPSESMPIDMLPLDIVSLAIESPAPLLAAAAPVRVDSASDESPSSVASPDDLQLAIAALLRDYHDPLDDRFGLGAAAVPVERQLRDRLFRNHHTP